MTINELQKSLIRKIEQVTEDMNLIDKYGNKAKLKGYQQAIPIQPVFGAVPYEENEGIWNEDDGIDSLFPYFIVRSSEARYRRAEWDGSSRADIMIAFAIYDDDSELRGYYTLTAVMERVVEYFLKNPVLDAFSCNGEIQLAFQEDDTYPQFFGAIEMWWDLPSTEVLPVLEEFL